MRVFSALCQRFKTQPFAFICLYNCVIVSPQLVKLFENLECHMITELRKKLARELTLVLAERGRIEETALPTDLWKRPVCPVDIINLRVYRG